MALTLLIITSFSSFISSLNRPDKLDSLLICVCHQSDKRANMKNLSLNTRTDMNICSKHAVFLFCFASVLSERISAFNGPLESAQASLKVPDYHHCTQAKLTLDTFTAACQYNLQAAAHKYPVRILK